MRPLLCGFLKKLQTNREFHKPIAQLVIISELLLFLPKTRYQAHFADFVVVFGGAICYALAVADRVSTRYLLQTPPTGLQQWAGYSTNQIVSPKQANDYNNVKFRLIVQYQASVIVQNAHQQNTQKRLIMFMHICSLYFYAYAVLLKAGHSNIHNSSSRAFSMRRMSAFGCKLPFRTRAIKRDSLLRIAITSALFRKM